MHLCVSEHYPLFPATSYFLAKKKNPCKSNPTRKCTSISPPITTDNVAHLDFDGNYHLALPDLYHDFSFRRAHVCVCVCTAMSVLLLFALFH